MWLQPRPLGNSQRPSVSSMVWSDNLNLLSSRKVVLCRLSGRKLEGCVIPVDFLQPSCNSTISDIDPQRGQRQRYQTEKEYRVLQDRLRHPVSGYSRSSVLARVTYFSTNLTALLSHPVESSSSPESGEQRPRPRLGLQSGNSGEKPKSSRYQESTLKRCVWYVMPKPERKLKTDSL